MYLQYKYSSSKFIGTHKNVPRIYYVYIFKVIANMCFEIQFSFSINRQCEGNYVFAF